VAGEANLQIQPLHKDDLKLKLLKTLLNNKSKVNYEHRRGSNYKPDTSGDSLHNNGVRAS
ncbi:hypothetical protein KAX75_08105, partial [candidate division WOR-3 bacterium]|nr:hypothetical protein [candidate division WOR-3 bacterium]